MTHYHLKRKTPSPLSLGRRAVCYLAWCPRGPAHSGRGWVGGWWRWSLPPGAPTLQQTDSIAAFTSRCANRERERARPREILVINRSFNRSVDRELILVHGATFPPHLGPWLLFMSSNSLFRHPTLVSGHLSYIHFPLGLLILTFPLLMSCTVFYCTCACNCMHCFVCIV